MDVSSVLLDILVVLVAAKVAAEVADRIGIPAVVGEIAAGVLIGPSLLGAVEPNEVLRTLAELGVILLLLEVGLEMDLRELRSVGRAALLVAVIGVALPMAGGSIAALGLGMDGNEALFIGAALTATSVGITARVFGDLRALATVEARTVLGAAVADDILGLIVLTVVTRIVTEGSVEALGVVEVVGVALAFVVVATVVGMRIAPPLFAGIRRYSRSTGTLVAIALAFTLAFAELANAADLAPIIGAFVAGLAIGRSNAAHHVRRELAPVGHLLVPVFFLQIGIDADLEAMADGKVIVIAAALLAVGVVGKIAASAGMFGAPGDKFLVGIGMIPRGEVGLIFATIGLREGVFDQQAYGALLLVVLATTVFTPPALRWRLMRLRPKAKGGDHTLVAALAAARRCAHEAPDEELREWFDSFPPVAQRWDAPAREEFRRLLEHGTARSWRLLTVSGVLHRALPELDDALAHRGGGLELDPLGALQFERLDAVRRTAAADGSPPREVLLLAAFVLDACDGTDDPMRVARRTGQRLGIEADLERALAGMIGDARLLAAAARRVDALDEEAVQRVAVHIGSAEQASGLYALTRATFEGDEWERDRLDELHDLVQKVLAEGDVVGTAAEVERRRAVALAHADNAATRARVESAPREFVLAQPPLELLRHARRCDPAPGRYEVSVSVGAEGDQWRVDVVARDRIGLLARVARALDEFRCGVRAALVVTWPDGVALSSFVVTSPPPDGDLLSERLNALLRMPVDAPALPDVAVTFDDHGSPWHTRCSVETTDVPGLLRSLTAAFAVAGVDVHAARVVTEGATAIDAFDLTDRNGAKLDEGTKSRVRELLREGVNQRGRRLAWR